MKRIVSASALAVAMISAPALAQEVGPTVGGPRIEANVGWDNVGISIDGEGGSKSGVTYGGELGYDIPLGTSAIVGAYVGADGSSTKECESDGTERLCVKAGRNLTAGVRVGALVGTRSIVYGKGGYSNGRISAEYTDTAFPSDNFDEGTNLDGFHLGAGVQTSFNGGVYGKIEYNYTKYSTNEDTGFDVDIHRHRVVVGVGIGF